MPDLEAAFDELARVVRPGGRVAVFDADWSTLTWHAADGARNDRVVEAFDAHCPHPRLARTIEARLEAHGFEVVDRAVHVHLDTDGSEGTVGTALANLVADFAVDDAGLDGAAVAAWIDDLGARADAGEYFFSFNQYLFVGERPVDA